MTPAASEKIAQPFIGARGKRTLVAIGAAIACLAAVWVGAVVRRPFLLADNLEAENVVLEKRALTLQIENQSQKKELAALLTPQGKEREARRLGFVKKGEVPLFIPR